MFASRADPRRHAVAELRHLRPGVRADASTLPRAAGQRGVPRLREVPAAPVGPRTAPTACAPLLGRAQPHPPRAPGAAADLRTLRFHDTDNDALLCYSKTDPAGDRPADARRRQPRPAPRARPAASTSTSPPLGLPYEPTVRRRRPARPTRRYRWHGARELRRARPVRRPPTSSASSAVASSASATTPDELRRSSTARRPRRPTDPPDWYQDAIIYELHVRAFADSNGDGIGDFNGLTPAARLPRRPRRHRDLAAAVLPVAAARRRLRHRRLPHRPPRLRRPARRSGASSTRPTTAACA